MSFANSFALLGDGDNAPAATKPTAAAKPNKAVAKKEQNNKRKWHKDRQQEVCTARMHA